MRAATCVEKPFFVNRLAVKNAKAGLEKGYPKDASASYCWWLFFEFIALLNTNL